MAGSKSKAPFIDINHHRRFHRHLQILMDDDILTDFTLIAKGNTIRCHKLVLAASSPYFKAMMTSALKESTSNTMEVQDADPTVLLALVKYMYSGEIVINTENAEAIVQMSHQYQLEALQEAAESFMVKKVEPFNCLSFYKFAKTYNLEKLRSNAHQCMLKRFKEVVTASGESEFLQLSCDDLEEYIKDDNLRVKTEDDVFHAVVTWVNHDLSTRRDMFQKLLGQVRLPFCTSAYLHHVVRRETLMSPPECQEILNKAKMYQMDPEERKGMNISPRKCFNMLERMYVVACGSTIKSPPGVWSSGLWSLEEGGQWEELPQLPVTWDQYPHICITSNALILSGGKGCTRPKKQCWLFDMEENEWKKFPSLLEGRFRHGSVAQGDSIYVIGGERGSFRGLSSVEKYTKNAKKWSPCPELPQAIIHPVVVAHKGQVYVFGGCTVGSDPPFLRHTQVLDPVLDTWSFKAKMPLSCAFAAAAGLGDNIYLVSGFSRSCMSYLPALDMWTILSQPLRPRNGAQAVVWKDKILLGGGLCEDGSTAEINEYDPELDTWTKWENTQLPKPMSSHFMFSVPARESNSKC